MSTDNNHKEYINKNGEKVMRITEVIKILAKDSIAVWANMLGFKRISYKGELERTANIGNMVHGTLEDFADSSTITEINRYFDYNLYNYTDQIEASNALRSFFKWYDKYSKAYKPIKTEVTLIGETVGGTIDVILQSPFNKKKIIIGDYKTSKDVYLSMVLQLSGYVYLYEEINGKNTCDGIVIFSLDKKEGKKAKTYFFHREDLDKYINAFKTLLQTAIQIKELESNFKSDSNKLENVII